MLQWDGLNRRGDAVGKLPWTDLKLRARFNSAYGVAIRAASSLKLSSLSLVVKYGDGKKQVRDASTGINKATDSEWLRWLSIAFGRDHGKGIFLNKVTRPKLRCSNEIINHANGLLTTSSKNLESIVA